MVILYPIFTLREIIIPKMNKKLVARAFVFFLLGASIISCNPEDEMDGTSGKDGIDGINGQDGEKSKDCTPPTSTFLNKQTVVYSSIIQFINPYS